jgi:peptidyl-tRNA hydrolase
MDIITNQVSSSHDRRSNRKKLNELFSEWRKKSEIKLSLKYSSKTKINGRKDKRKKGLLGVFAVAEN